jgi:segregation and condensation protein B
MARKTRKPDDLALEQFQEVSDDQGLSLDELSESFARLLGAGDVPYDALGDDAEPHPGAKTTAADPSSVANSGPARQLTAARASADWPDGRSLEDCPVSPENIIEAILFVGHPQGEPIASRHIASLMRGVRAAEVEALIAELNESYRKHNCPYTVESASTGFRMVLRPEYHSVREQFYGRIREAQLTQTAVNTLAIVAYHQPLDKQQIVKISGEEQVGRVLAQLVRRGLLSAVRGEAPLPGAAQRPKKPPIVYQTTDRFLHLFGLRSLADLPQNHELADS